MHFTYTANCFPIKMFRGSIYDYPRLEGNVSDKEYNSSYFRNLWELSSDLHYLLRESVMSDFLLLLNGTETIYCHKEILKNRSRLFRAKIEEAEKKGYIQIEISENRKILDAVLFYTYSGNLKHLELMDVSLMELRRASKKYGLLHLDKKLGVIARKKNVQERMKTLDFLWQIRVKEYRSLNTQCSLLDSFSLSGTDRWILRIKQIPNDIQPRNGVFLKRETKGNSSETSLTSHTLFFQMNVVDANETNLKTFSTQDIIDNDEEILLFKLFTFAEAAKSGNSLMPGSMLRLACNMSFSAQSGRMEKFRLEEPHCRLLFNELVKLSDDMYRLYKFEKKCHDLKFTVTPSYTCSMHACIFFVRTRVPYNSAQTLVREARMGCIGGLSFISFLYTGQSRFLDDHARDVYLALSRTAFTEAKNKYSTYLSMNINLENAFDLMCDALKCNDDELLNAAAIFLAKKSDTITDHKVWIRIASDKMNLLTGFLPRLHGASAPN